jgi:hypothetical protein
MRSKSLRKNVGKAVPRRFVVKTMFGFRAGRRSGLHDAFAGIGRGEDNDRRLRQQHHVTHGPLRSADRSVRLQLGIEEEDLAGRNLFRRRRPVLHAIEQRHQRRDILAGDFLGVLADEIDERQRQRDRLLLRLRHGNTRQ